MKVKIYSIPDRLTGLRSKRIHTWAGIKLDNGDHLFVLKTETDVTNNNVCCFNWYMGRDKTMYALNTDKYFIMEKQIFDSNYKKVKWLWANRQSPKDYIVDNKHDNKHIYQLTNAQWKMVFKAALDHAEDYRKVVMTKNKKIAHDDKYKKIWIGSIICVAVIVIAVIAIVVAFTATR